MSTMLVSAADERYGYWLLNLLGSVDANSRVFDGIVVYDLGLSRFQRRLADRIDGIEIREVPDFVPHWRQGRTWKLWIWRHLEAEKILWLDAGVSVLRNVAEPLTQIDERGYFAVANGHPNRESIPADWYDLYGITPDLADRIGISTGIFGFRTNGEIFDRVIVPSFEDAVNGRCLGFSPADAHFNFGLDRLDDVVVRDCELFRWDQSVVNVHFFKALQDPYINDVYKYGGWISPKQHPEQLFWNHRRRGDFAYLSRIRFKRPLRPLGNAWGAWFRARWWAKNHSWLFRPATYLRKASRVAAAPFAR